MDTLREMLMAADETGELKHYQDIKIYYPMVRNENYQGSIKELSMNQTFEMMNIPSGAQFVLIGKKTFEWNPKKKGPNINVSGPQFRSHMAI